MSDFSQENHINLQITMDNENQINEVTQESLSICHDIVSISREQFYVSKITINNVLNDHHLESNTLQSNDVPHTKMCTDKFTPQNVKHLTSLKCI